jgi:hypothetical protein
MIDVDIYSINIYSAVEVDIDYAENAHPFITKILLVHNAKLVQMKSWRARAASGVKSVKIAVF